MRKCHFEKICIAGADVSATAADISYPLAALLYYVDQILLFRDAMRSGCCIDVTLYENLQNLIGLETTHSRAIGHTADKTNRISPPTVPHL